MSTVKIMKLLPYMLDQPQPLKYKIFSETLLEFEGFL